MMIDKQKICPREISSSAEVIFGAMRKIASRRSMGIRLSGKRFIESVPLIHTINDYYQSTMNINVGER